DKGRPLPKFGEWDVNDPASAEGFTVIFNKARNEKKTGGKPESPTKEESAYRPGATLGKPQSVSCDGFTSSLVLPPRKNGFAVYLPTQNLEVLELVRLMYAPPHHIFQ
ncbi:hypothetical protein C3L33_10270, partial [Rhododendron williamsianum]